MNKPKEKVYEKRELTMLRIVIAFTFYIFKRE